MPQSVEAYLGGGERKLEASELAKREILALYEKDIGKYAKGYASKVRAIFRTIPGALNSREKKFHLSDLSVNARMRRYENAFLWLSDAMVANIAYNSTNPDVALEMSLESSLFKCYSHDTGLLLSQAMSGSGDVDGRLLSVLRRDDALRPLPPRVGGREEDADLTGKNAYNTQHNRRKERIHGNRKST